MSGPRAMHRRNTTPPRTWASTLRLARKHLLVGGVILTLFAACKPAERRTRADQAVEDKTLLRGNGQDPDSLDPHLATSVSAGNILMNLFEGLTRLHPETLDPEPAMAERWEISDDGLRIVFHLREAYWSNGDPVTAGDFVFAWRRMLRPELAAAYAYMLFPIGNAAQIHAGELPADSLAVQALDSRTLELRLHRPVPYLFALLAHWTWYPLHTESLTRAGADTDRTAVWTRPDTMIVNGPFTLGRWQPQQEITLHRNPRYWQADSVWLNAARFFPFGDPSTEERAFRTGDLHVTYSLPRQRLNHYRELQAPELRMDPYLESVGWIINHRRPPLDQPEFRQALSLSLDRAMIARVLGGTRLPALTHVPPGLKGYASPPGLIEDPRLAINILQQIGFSDGSGLPELELILPNRGDWVRVAEVMREQWAAVGIRIAIHSLERGTYFTRRREGKFDLCFLGWVGDFPDPSAFLGLWHSDAGNNFSGWAHPAYDDLLELSAHDHPNRFHHLQTAETILLTELPVIPVAFGATQYLLDPRVHHWYPNLLDHHPLRAVKLKK